MERNWYGLNDWQTVKIFALAAAVFATVILLLWALEKPRKREKLVQDALEKAEHKLQETPEMDELERVFSLEFPADTREMLKRKVGDRWG